MFSPSIPFTSFLPMPPTPMHATLSVSLGARRPRPSTWRGTIVKSPAALKSPTNLRLVIRLRVMANSLRDGLGTGTGTEQDGKDDEEDRKSTRLNSSHPSISYAVFCLKKKTTI